MARKRTVGILDGVDRLFEQWLGIATTAAYGKHPLTSRRALIDLSENRHRHIRPKVQAAECFRQVMACMEENYQALGKSKPSATNWQWNRPATVDLASVNGEKREERLAAQTIVQIMGEDWGTQVPVCDGLGKPRDLLPRIDLIHYIIGHTFDIIELKYGAKNQGYGSDTPLVAAMQLVKYGLLYLFSRKKQLYGKQQGKNNLLAAKELDLIVLAPPGYYTYEPSHGEARQYDLGWLQEGVNEGFAECRKPLGRSLSTMRFSFQCLSEQFETLYPCLRKSISQFRKNAMLFRPGFLS